MGTVAVFLQVYDDADDYDVLNRLICAWRESEEKTRAECGLDSVLTEYPGCVRYTRGQTQGAASSTKANARKVRNSRNEPVVANTKAMSAHDLILHNHMQMTADHDYDPATIQMNSDEDFSGRSDFDWDAFVAEQYDKDDHHGRELLNYEHVGWFNYFPMIGARTEYYFRYSGTQTIPPCYGNFYQPSNRKHTNAWRAMKDPIRISQRQLDEMRRLLRERIAPLDDPLASCQPDTAAKVDVATGDVSTARPLQSKHKAHFAVFCECDDWISKWPEDREWCKKTDKLARFSDRPYNFATNGF